MSHIMEKTLATLPKLLTQSLGGGKGQTQSGPTPLGQEVINFMKTVHRARSKSQESAIVQAELAAINEKLKQAGMSSSSLTTVRNAFTKVIFCHLLGYDVTFLVINAMKLCQQCRGYEKRLGYLVTCLLLHRNHEMALLMLCTLQKDIQSPNMEDNLMALVMAGQLVAEDHIQYILSAVVDRLKHRHDLVKEKAVHCLVAFHSIAPTVIQPALPELASLLSSRDPGVLNALINLYVPLSEENPGKLVGLGTSFLHILHQIINRGFGSSFYYHMVPLPWLQINLLKVLGNLAAVDSNLCRSLCPVLEALIERTKVTEPISLAILMESVKTATKVKADDKLLDLCSLCVGKLLSPSALNNMRYQGLGLLIALSKLKPAFAARHQVAVVECLNDSDHAIQARTTHLLHAMANTANVRAICEKLFEQLNKRDLSRRQDILLMVSDLAERLITSINFYLQMYFRIFLNNHLSNAMRASFVELVLSRVEGFVRDTSSKPDMSAAHLAKDMIALLQNEQTTLPNILLAVQVLGSLAPALKTQPVIEDSFLSTIQKYFAIVTQKCNDKNQCLLFSPHDMQVQGSLKTSRMNELQCTCLQVLVKMVLGGCLEAFSVKKWLESLDKSDLCQNFETQCYFDELSNLVSHPQDIAVRAEIMFKGDSCTLLDLSLSFMDELVVHNLMQGEDCFVPQYVLWAKKNAGLTSSCSTSLDTSMVSSPASDNTQTSTPASLQTSMLTKSSTSTPNKWRDFDEEAGDDEEQFTLVDVEEENAASGQTVGPERELFAGLENLSLSHEMPSTHPGKHKSLWDDERHDNDMSINIGFNLHPFGLPRRSKSHAAKWFDEDENDNPRLDCDKNSNAEDFSSVSEKCEAPLIAPASNSIYAELQDSVTELDIFQGSPYPVGKAVNKARDHFGVSSPRIHDQSPLGMSMSSTVDTLTDSDPSEESDNDAEAGKPRSKAQPV